MINDLTSRGAIRLKTLDGESLANFIRGAVV